MNAFIPLAHIDVWALSASLRSKGSLLDAGPFVAIADGERHRELQEWRALSNVVVRIRKLPLADRVEFLTFRLERQMPATEGLWSICPVENAVLPLWSNPQCWHYSGTSILHLPIGALTLLGRGLPRCCVNWGAEPAFHLWVEFRQREPEDE